MLDYGKIDSIIASVITVKDAPLLVNIYRKWQVPGTRVE